MPEKEQPERIEAHHVFKQHAPTKVRVNLPDGSPKDIAIDDQAELEAHGLVACGSCGAPNHVMQITENENPWIQCGCTGKRVEVAVSKKGLAHIGRMRDQMHAALTEGKGVVNRG